MAPELEKSLLRAKKHAAYRAFEMTLAWETELLPAEVCRCLRRMGSRCPGSCQGSLEEVFRA